jgi:hypothetical protein
LGQVDPLTAIPVGDVEDRLVETGGYPLAHVQCPFVRRLAASDQPASVPKLDAHARGDDTPRDVDYMDGHPRHQFSFAPESLTG